MTDERKRSVWPTAVAGVVLTLVLYVASTGPVFAMLDTYVPGEDSLWSRILYAPVFWAVQRSDFASRAVLDYEIFCLPWVPE